MFCIGTRPEAIKLAPLILEAKKQGFETQVVVSGQHKEMLEPFLQFFKLDVFSNLQVLKPNQTLSELTSTILSRMTPLLAQEKPDLLLVQGDTTTAMTCALAAFYEKIQVAHIEAGLRTHDPYSPFPEEMNRKLISAIAHFHFAPTSESEQNLAREGISKNVWVTGNTGIDALRITSEKIQSTLTADSQQILVTCHRRENHGEPLVRILDAILKILDLNPKANVVFPVHLNPNVQALVHEKLGKHERVRLTQPMDYLDFAKAMKESRVILTDSGGVQEEAPYFKKPIFIMRESTERPEGVHAGVAELVGSDAEKIVKSVTRALTDAEYEAKFQQAISPYGDGFASERILRTLKS